MTKLNKISLMALLLGSVFYLFSFYFLDQRIAFAFHTHLANGLSHDFYQLVTLFGDGKFATCFTLFSFIASVLILFRHPQSRMGNNLLLLGIAMSVAIFAETFLKYLLGRYRPEMLFTQGLYGFHYLSHQFLLNSTPSGHATRVFVFVTGFSLIWKRLTPVFILIGLLVCLSRLALEFHFLSDVVFGALLGTVITLWIAKVYHSMTLSNSISTSQKSLFNSF